LEQPTLGKLILSVLPSTRRVGSKSWYVEGFNNTSQRWEWVASDQTYTQLQAGLQLVNRHGAINDVEFSEFVVKVQSMADALGANAAFPEMLQEVSRARELDHFASALDVKISLKLRAKRLPWSPAYVQQKAIQAGFYRGAIVGQWILLEAVVLSLDMHAAMTDDHANVPIHDIMLNIDVPQIDRDVNAYGLLLDVANRLCIAMEAHIVDENDQPVDTDTLQRGHAQLTHIYEQLERYDIPAGSLLAKRLFS
jgi:hypothetical protein